MKCPKCGQPLPDDSVFCQYCGANILSFEITKTEEINDEYLIDTLKDNPADETLPVTPDIVPTSKEAGIVIDAAKNTAVMCNNCGQPLPNDSMFCQYCGASISSREKQDNNDMGYVPPEKPLQNDKDKFNPAVKQDTDFSGFSSGERVSVVPNAADSDYNKQIRYGKKHNKSKVTLPVVIISVIAVALAGLNLIQYIRNQNTSARLTEYVQALSERDSIIEDRNNQISDLESDISKKDITISKDKTKINSLEKDVGTYKSKAGYYDAIIGAANSGNLGYGAYNFQTDESVIVLKKNQSATITLTAYWSSGGYVYINYTPSTYPSASISFDNNSWTTSTTLTITPNYEGVTKATFSNDVDYNTFNIIIIVTG